MNCPNLIQLKAAFARAALRTSGRLLCLIMLITVIINDKANAQGIAYRDSILKILAQTNHDSVKARLMSQLGFFYRTVNTDSGMWYARKALELAWKTNTARNAALAFNALGTNFTVQGLYDSALVCFNKSREASLSVSDTTTIGNYYNNVGIVYDRKGFPEKALESYIRAAETYEKQNDKLRLASALENIGNMHRKYFRKYDEAISYINRSLQLRLEINDHANIGSSQQKLGMVYWDLHNNDSARFYLEQSIESDKKEGIKFRIISSATMLGKIYLEGGEFNTAENWFREGLALSETGNYKTWQAMALSNYGVLQCRTGRTEDGLRNSMEGLRLAKSLQEPNRIRDAHENLQIIYEIIGDSAKAYFHNIQYRLIRDSIDNIEKVRLLGELSERYEKSKKENEIHRLLTEKEISRLNMERKSALLEGKIKEAKIRETEIGLLQKEKELKDLELKRKEEALRRAAIEADASAKDLSISRQISEQKEKELAYRQMEKWYILSGGTIIILLGTIVFVQYRRIQKRKNQEEHRLLKHELDALRMESLRAQMNPHFIFNALNSINRYILRNEKEKASEYLITFSRLVRMILENSKSTEISLRNELEALRLYASLEQLRFDHRFDFEIKTASDLDPECTLVPPMIIQPYVENAIWHGLMPKDGSGKISIDINEMVPGTLIIKITDDGVGRSSAATTRNNSIGSKSSLGMKITHARLQSESQGGTMLINDLVDAAGEPAGTCVELTLKYHKIKTAKAYENNIG